MILWAWPLVMAGKIRRPNQKYKLVAEFPTRAGQDLTDQNVKHTGGGSADANWSSLDLTTGDLVRGYDLAARQRQSWLL